MAGVLVDQSSAVLANVGDCRVYLLRDEKLVQLTRDHSWVADAVRAGDLDAEEARVHPLRNLVTRAIAGEDHLEVDIVPIALLDGDLLLLCSDGLHGPVTDEEIRSTLLAAEEPSEACTALVKAANAHGGPDNVTAVIVRYGLGQKSEADMPTVKNMSLLKFIGLTEASDASTPDVSEGDTDAMSRVVSQLEAMNEKRARYLAAFAYVLGRVAHADSHFSVEETSKMQEIVKNLGHLTEAQAVLVVEIAKTQIRLSGAREYALVVRRFKEMSTAEQRVELLDCVFAVSAADDSISAAEEGQAGQIANELGLSSEEFVAARSAYQEHLESLKRSGQS